MGTVGGPRHYHGPEQEARYRWICPSCGTEHLTPMEEGCPSCGAGTAAQNEMAVAQAAQVATPVEEETLQGRVLRPDYLPGTVEAAELLRFDGFTDAAIQTVASALAFYAENATLGTDELTRAQTLSWAQLLNKAVTE